MPTRKEPCRGRPKAPRGYKYRNAAVTVTMRREERASVENCARAHGVTLAEALLRAHEEHCTREHRPQPKGGSTNG